VTNQIVRSGFSEPLVFYRPVNGYSQAAQVSKVFREYSVDLLHGRSQSVILASQGGSIMQVREESRRMV